MKSFRGFSRVSSPWPVALLLAALPLHAQTPAAPAPVVPYAPKTPETVTLKSAFKGIFHVGVALNPGQFTGTNARGAALVAREFDCISPENVLKWDAVEPQNGEFRVAGGDQYVEFGLKNKMWIIGHNLCWHSQLPAWVSAPDAGQSELTKEVLLARLKRHVMTVAAHYRGKINGWDVVNEAITDGGQYRPSVFYKIIGSEYLPLAFKWAHEADPTAELYYNDYNLDVSDAKRAKTIELVRYLREQGAPIDGIGLQGHYNLTTPAPAKIDETIRMFAALGLKVMITELDVQVVRNAAITGAVGANPGGAASRPPLTDEQQQALSKRYAELFAVFLQHRDAITRVTFWGLRDADSWRRNSSPLLFDDSYQRKPAYDGVISALNAAKAAKP